MLLWERINHLIRTDPRVQFRGDAGFPRIIVDSVPDMGASMELPEREPDVRPIVLDAVHGLCKAGATAVGIACNTTQYFAREIGAMCSRFGARFVSLAEETAAYLERTQTNSFDLLGIKSVTDLDGWSDFGRALGGFDVHVPDPRQVEAITELAFRVKRELVTPATVNRLRDLINRSTETDTVVLALTELSILWSRQNGPPRSGKRFIDTLDILASSMAEIYLEERIATGGA
ncbi:MAG TPA: aspartate/glutamate racemase family protein [Acidimicrobiales bacterium]|nr:aspartate/glutamate racemase family protein [Acidimicrobiales bacterium]